MCEKTGADVNEVMHAVGMDARIGELASRCRRSHCAAMVAVRCRVRALVIQPVKHWCT